MKATKIILALLVAQLLCFIVPKTVVCQTESLDIIQYTPPKGWVKTPKDGAIVYSVLNKTSGSICLLTIYASSPGTGDPAKDFTREWNNLAVSPFKAQPNVKTDKQTDPEGWHATVGGSEIEMSGVKALAVLTVFSGFGRTVSVLDIFNDQKYLADAETLVSSIKLDKKAALALAQQTQKAPDTPASNSEFLDFDPFPDKPYVQAQKPLLGRLRKSITLADLAGKWQIGGANVMSYFSGGNFSHTDTTFFGEWYTIRADGTFDSKFQGRTGNTTIREADSGTIILNGGTVTFKYKQKPAMRYQFVAYMSQPNGAAVLTLIYIGNNAPLDANALSASCGHANGWVSCVTGEEFVRIP